MTLSQEEIRHIAVEIHNERGHHGSFLKTLAQAYLLADLLNAEILSYSVGQIFLKYKLEEYLDNFRQHQ